MGYVKTDEQNYYNIADALRAKYGTSQTFYPVQMASAITNIPSGTSSVLLAGYGFITSSVITINSSIFSNACLFFDKELE